MNVVVAIDSLKGSLSSMEAGLAISSGIKRVYQDAEVVVRPIADGGEGTCEALIEGLGGRKVELEVVGPLGEAVSCYYGVVGAQDDGSSATPSLAPAFAKEGAECGSLTAIMEMAAASGITLVPRERLNPLKATSYGVGQMIAHALDLGCRRFVIGIGGSATNDGGMGMLQALGFVFKDKDGCEVGLGAEALDKVCSVDISSVHPALKDAVFRIACDVDNPLFGERGCSYVYGPQKGATPDMVKAMDKAMASYADVMQKHFKNADPNVPGTGAAGGLGFAFLSCMESCLEPGIDIVLDETKLEEYVKSADLVITGEGRLDEQTVMGKAPSGVAKLAKKYELPVLAFAGAVTDSARVCNEAGIDAFFPILRAVVSLDEALDKANAAKNMTDTVEQAFRLIKCFKEQ